MPLLLQSTRSFSLSAPHPTLLLPLPPPLAPAGAALLDMGAGTRAAAFRSEAEDKEPAEVIYEEEEEEEGCITRAGIPSEARPPPPPPLLLMP